jgi:cytochrome c oxidase subunit 4
MEANSSDARQHAVGSGTYVLVWLGLVIMTGVTVTVAGIDLGGMNVVAALLIASVKSTLVLYWFMHLKYEEGLFRVILFAAVATISIIIGLTFLDILYR